MTPQTRSASKHKPPTHPITSLNTPSARPHATSTPSSHPSSASTSPLPPHFLVCNAQPLPPNTLECPTPPAPAKPACFQSSPTDPSYSPTGASATPALAGSPQQPSTPGTFSRSPRRTSQAWICAESFCRWGMTRARRHANYRGGRQ
jgi:hypothetical protein